MKVLQIIPIEAGAHKDRRRTLIRKAMTDATTSHGIGGRAKQRGGPKPVTLARSAKEDGR